ncbi:MAG: zf-TFIIB domain-containing protein [Planctomycetaceae bacterium]
MKCPKCETGVLKPVRVNSVEVDQCSACRGVWFDEPELSVLLGCEKRELKVLSGRQNERLDHKHGDCPRDSTRLTRMCSSLNPDVVVDVCPTCHGIWLDGGELQKLVSE